MAIIQMAVENTSAEVRAFGGRPTQTMVPRALQYYCSPDALISNSFLRRSGSRIYSPLWLVGKVSRSSEKDDSVGTQTPGYRFETATTSPFAKSTNSSPPSVLRHISCFSLPVSMAMTQKPIALAYYT